VNLLVWAASESHLPEEELVVVSSRVRTHHGFRNSRSEGPGGLVDLGVVGQASRWLGALVEVLEDSLEAAGEAKWWEPHWWEARWGTE